MLAALSMISIAIKHRDRVAADQHPEQRPIENEAAAK